VTLLPGAVLCQGVEDRRFGPLNWVLKLPADSRLELAASRVLHTADVAKDDSRSTLGGRLRRPAIREGLGNKPTCEPMHKSRCPPVKADSTPLLHLCAYEFAPPADLDIHREFYVAGGEVAVRCIKSGRLHGCTSLPGGQAKRRRSATVLEFDVLGPLLVEGESGDIAIPGARRRALLIRLLVSANHAISADLLIEDVWDGNPPTGASQTLQSHLSYLRKTLGRDRIQHRAAGYVLTCTDQELDFRQFEIRCDLGSRAHAAGDFVTAMQELGSALDLWRADPLSDVNDASWALPKIARLDEMKATALEMRIDAMLSLGQHLEAVTHAEAAVADHALSERFWAQLILALYRSGRQADALRAFQRLRSRLAEELGIEPCAELVALEEAVLLQNPELNFQESPSSRTKIEEASVDGERLLLPSRLVAETSGVFVGRRVELQQLEDLWKHARERHLRIAMLGGEPGIGKTSLATALATRVWEQGGMVLYGRCDEDLGIPYQPWVEVLRHLVRHGSDSLFDDHTRSRVAELARLLPELSDRTGVAMSEVLPDDSERYLLYGAAADLLKRSSELAPTLVVLDDLHWADRPTIQLLRHVVTSCSQLRVMIVGTYRDSELGTGHPLVDALATFHREHGVDRLSLQGLSDTELLEMLESLIGDEVPQHEARLRNALMDETRGNPFFAGEILRHLRETGSISHVVDDQSVIVDSIDLSRLPVSIREVVGHRVSRLGHSAVQWLTMAAVIGRDFDIDLLARVVSVDQEALVATLEAAVESGILVEREVAGQFSFAHALTGHALYRDLSALRRARGHRSVAEAIEESCDGDFTTRVGELAHHWANATQPQALNKAIEYAQLAGDRANRMLAPDESVRWYEESLRMLHRQDSDDDWRRAVLLASLGDAQRQIGNPAFRRTLLEAAHLANRTGDAATLVRAALANDRGFVSSAGSVDVEKVEILEMALERLPASSPDRALVLATLCAELAYAIPLERRQAMADEALAIARSSDDDIVIVKVLAHIAFPLMVPSLLEQSLAWSVEALTRAERIGDPVLVNHAAEICVSAASRAGDIDEVDRYLKIAGSAAQQIDQPTINWNHLMGCGMRAMIAGDVAELEQFATVSFKIGADSGQPDAAVIFGAQLIGLNAERGSLSELIPLIEQAIADNPGLPSFAAALALAHAEADRTEDTALLLQEFATREFNLPLDQLWMTGMSCYAEAAIVRGDPSYALPLFEVLAPWVHQLSCNGATAEGPVSHFLGGLASVIGRYDEANEYFAISSEFCDRVDAIFFAARTNLSWGRMLVLRQAPGDAEKAWKLLTKARDDARANGYRNIERRATAALQGLNDPVRG
jgi:DNA-binding SARP family transcriptional activator